MSILLISLASLLLARLITPFLGEFLSLQGIQAVNFRGRVIPVGAGLAIPAAALPAYAAMAWIKPEISLEILMIISVVTGAALVGFIDDVAGEGEPKGLRGHAASLIRGRITAGSIKALSIAAFSLLAGMAVKGDPLGVVLMAGLVSLGANAINSFDLRPGRAGGAFLAAGFPMALLAGPPATGLLLPLAGALTGYLKWDRRGVVMMGDAGANALGAALGAVTALTPSLSVRLWALAGLLILHYVTERYSLTRIIAGIEGWSGLSK